MVEFKSSYAQDHVLHFKTFVNQIQSDIPTPRKFENWQIKIEVGYFMEVTPSTN